MSIVFVYQPEKESSITRTLQFSVTAQVQKPNLDFANLWTQQENTED